MTSTFGWEDRDQAPRERLLSKGSGALSDRELVAILLRTGRAGENVLRLADRLLEDGLRALAQASPADLLRMPGLGPAKASSLAAAFELGRRAAGKDEVRPAFDRPEVLFEYVRWRLPMDREELRAFYLDSRLRLLSEEVVSMGGRGWTPVHPQDVFGPALRRRAQAVVLVHNHLGGDPTPSHADVVATRRLGEAGFLLGIDLLDHLVVSGSTFFSFRRQSLLGHRGKESSRR